jgi:ankyrin repeat protein
VSETKEHPVIGLARDGDTTAMSQLLHEDPTAVNARGWMGITPLHAAAEGGSAAAVELLLRFGANARARRDNGDTPLHWAASEEVAELLIRAAQAGRPNQRNDLQQTPLHTCADGDVAEVLVRHHASLIARDFGGATPLGDAGVAKARVLLQAGADVDARDHKGRTALHRAVVRGDDQLTALLLAAGADPSLRDAAGASPVHVAGRPEAHQVRERLLTALASGHRSLAEAVDPVRASHLRQRAPQADAGGRSVFSVAGHAVLVRWLIDGNPRPEAIAATEHRTLSAIAVDPRGGLVAVAPAEASVEFRRTDDLSVTSALNELVGATALAFSPDGRWLAVATDDERVLLVEPETGRIAAEIEAGERTDSVAFSPDGTLLATACSFQGGAHVRIDRVNEGGRLDEHVTIDRAGRRTAPEHFVDTIPGLAFTTTGQLTIWETSAIYQERRTQGWRGNLLLADTNGRVLWQRSIDAAITGNRTSLEVCGSSMGYFTTPVASAGGAWIAVALDGVVVRLGVADGSTEAVVPISGKANAVVTDGAAGNLVIATDGGWQLAFV